MQLVDDKGRVAIPAALRATIEKNAAPGTDPKLMRQITVSTHQSQPCLVAYDEAFFDIKAAELKERERSHTGPRGESDPNILREIGPAETVGYDPSGRFIMPAFPRFYANIGGYAFFYGAVDYFEIWDPKTLLETEGVLEIVKAACRFHMAEKGIAL